MRFLEQLDKHIFKLHISVKVNSKRQEIIDSEEYLIIQVRSKPFKNKANNELISLLRNKLRIASNQIKIISGRKSSNKIVQITFQEEEGKQLLVNRLLNQ